VPAAPPAPTERRTEAPPARTDRKAVAPAATRAAPADPAQDVAPAPVAPELDLESAALAATAWAEDDAQLVVPAAVAAPPEALDDPFDWFDLGSDAPLELIDDTHATPKAGARR
jgi:hypothetical protein